MDNNERTQRIKILIAVLSEKVITKMNSDDINYLISDKCWAILTSGLTEREIEVLNYRINTSATLEEIGKRLNITRERVRQIEFKAKRKICLKYKNGALIKDLKEEKESIRKMISEEIRKNSVFLEKLAEKNKDLAKQLEIEYHQSKECEFYSIGDLNLSVRTYNCLNRAGYKTLGDLLKTSRTQLMKIRNLGRNSLNEIDKKVVEFGYKIPFQNDRDGIKTDIMGRIIHE